MTLVNAHRVLQGPPGTRAIVAGQGGEGADIRFVDQSEAVVLTREVKSIEGLQKLDQRISEARKQLLEKTEGVTPQTGKHIFVQVPPGTTKLDVLGRLAGFRGQRGRNLADYDGIWLTVVDEIGQILYDGPVAGAVAAPVVPPVGGAP